MSCILTLDLYSTHYTIEGTKEGFVSDLKIPIDPVLTKLQVPVFDRFGKFITLTRFYRWSMGKFHLPITTLSMMKELLDKVKEFKQDFDYTTVQHAAIPTKRQNEKLQLEMKPGWHDRPEHELAFAHLLNYDSAIVGNDLQTGKGKTYVGIKLSTILNVATMVVCDGLVEQWVDNFLEKTTIPREKIFVIQGRDSISKLWNIVDDPKSLQPWVIIASLKTLSKYAMYTEDIYKTFPRLNDLLTKLNIGLIIYDEFHLSTPTIIKIMLMTNVNKTVLLSATPYRAKSSEQATLNRIIPKGMISGSADYDRYVTTYVHAYSIDLHTSQHRFNSFRYGYSHTKYETFLLCHKTYFPVFVMYIEQWILNAFIPVHNEDEETKCLVFVSTVEMAMQLTKILKQSFSMLNVVSYTAKDPIENLHDGDLIISTPTSCGVGKDIRNLTTVINTVSLASKPRVMQMFGRLRKIPKHECIFIDLFNRQVSAQISHFWQRIKIYEQISKYVYVKGIDNYKPKPWLEKKRNV